MATLPLIEQVKRQAYTTFSKLTNGVTTGFEENLSNLKGLMNRLSGVDVNLDTSLLEPIQKCMEKTCAPITYIEVLENPYFTMSIFVLRPGAKLPLHDHPSMYGLLKVIQGSVKIQSYSIPENAEYANSLGNKSLLSKVKREDIASFQDIVNNKMVLTVRKEPDAEVNVTDNVCVLSPLKNNIHEICSVNGGAAFLDVLSPPYYTEIPGYGPRPCRYYRELHDLVLEDDERSPFKILLCIPTPKEYCTISAPYQGL